ncbi:putative colanic acid biosynthesis acetyltransferase WcaF [Siphonobacter sp. SORGH_AS 1065]|nr:putative colanic acid biosynthesis acetyltransferase WcaF [Siphonobacter sp. SORGH_AS_1065]
MINTDTITGPSFSLKNRLCRFVWNCSSLLFFYYSPIPFHGWRRFVLRCFGAKVANGVHVYPGVKIWAPWNLSLDSECGIAKGAILYNQAPIHIGRRAVISQEAFLCSGTHDYQVPGFPLRAYPIHVGAHAWVAAQAFIHPGVTIGEGCVIGARSVVTRSMPEWMVCAGHPCQPIKERNRW